jgi:hypothetical protein
MFFDSCATLQPMNQETFVDSSKLFPFAVALSAGMLTVPAASDAADRNKGDAAVPSSRTPSHG